MKDSNIEKYKEILFSFIYRDEEFPAVINSKGFSLKGTVKIIFLSIARELGDLISGQDKHLNNKIWIYADSINQYRSLEFLNKLDNSVFITSSDELISSLPEVELTRLINPYKFLARFRVNSNIYRTLFSERYKTHFKTIFKYDGVYESLAKLFKNIKPAAIIMSNDHNAMNRSLLVAAKDAEIKCIYLQHAAVTNKFPPLKFDLSLLDGLDSFNKYKEAGDIGGEVELVGMPKFDPYYKYINCNTSVSKLGIALNANDNVIDYIQIVNEIKSNFPNWNYTFRFHPSMNSDEHDLPDFILISSPKEQSSFEFLKNIDVLIAGNSSIHLEASVMNVLSFSVKLPGSLDAMNDYYGFVKNGLIEAISVEKVVEFLSPLVKHKPDIRHRARYYVATIDTEYDGMSKEKVLKALKNAIL